MFSFCSEPFRKSSQSMLPANLKCTFCTIYIILYPFSRQQVQQFLHFFAHIGQSQGSGNRCVSKNKSSPSILLKSLFVSCPSLNLQSVDAFRTQFANEICKVHRIHAREVPNDPPQISSQKLKARAYANVREITRSPTVSCFFNFLPAVKKKERRGGRVQHEGQSADRHRHESGCNLYR